MDSMKNILLGTLENMVFCINKDSAPKFNSQIERKGCSIINCTKDWEQNRKTIFALSNICTEQCNDDYHFWFDHKCHFRCPQGTYPEGYICIKIKNETIDDASCNIYNFFMVGCKMDLNNDTAKQRFIEKTVSGFVSMELYDLAVIVLDSENIYTRTANGITFQLYALSNKKREENSAYLDLDICGETLKQKHRIPNDKLFVFKIEYHSDDYMVPIIEYNIFGREGKKKLNLNYCKSLKVNYLIPKVIDNYLEYIYDPNNKYYSDECYSPNSENKTDLTLFDRKDYFNKQNLSLCESICEFKGYLNNKIHCECEVKLKFNSYLNANSDKYNLVHRFNNLKLTKSTNIRVMKCFLNIFNFELLTSNLISLILLGIIVIFIFGTIIFFSCEKYSLSQKIPELLEAIELKTKTEGKVIPYAKNNENEMAKNKMKNNKAKNNLFNSKKGNLNKIKNNYLEYPPTSKEHVKGKDNSKNVLTLDQGNLTYNYKKIIKTKILILEKTDNELNFANYIEAKISDKRNCCKYYMSLLRTKHLLFFPFSLKNDFNPRSMKICYLFLILGFILTISALSLDDSDFHQLYISKGEFDIFFHLQKILIFSSVTIVIKNVLLWTIFIEKNFLEIKNKIIGGKIDRDNRDMANASFKCTCFFPLSIIILCLFWIYAMCFGSVFRNSYIHIFKMAIINLIIQVISPIIYNIFPCIFRMCALSGTKNREYLYRFSQFLQII